MVEHVVELLARQLAPDFLERGRVDELVNEVLEVLSTLDFSNKFQLVQDIIGKVIIKERRKVEIWTHIPLYTLKLGHEPICRDSRVAECGEEHIF